jgi:DNA-binding MarR family transcriptional regulator
MDDKLKVLEALKSSKEPLKPGEIADSIGMDRTIVDKQIKVLKTEGLIESPKRCYYSAK